jgi:hypothetical protein
MRRKKTTQPEVETDPRFPSGKWTGFWMQELYLGRQWMSLTLTFVNGQVRGEGCDCIGDFTMSGAYDLKTGLCRIVKTYRGAHSVEYEGRNEDDGMWIWGMWHIRRVDRGGFHLWPAGERDPTGRTLKEQKEQPSPRVRLAPLEPVGLS